MKAKEIITVLEELAPPEKALSWDSIGLQVGSRETEVDAILVCLDLTAPVLQEAQEKQCQMIVTHHPFLFRPLPSLCTETGRGKLVRDVAASALAVYAAHTNWDIADGGVNDALAARLGLTAIRKDRSGQHRFGELAVPASYSDFAKQVVQSLGCGGIQMVLPQEVIGGKVKRVGVSCGSFDGEWDWITEERLDILVTGELKHSDAVSFALEGSAVLCAGHFFTEIWGVKQLAACLNARLGGMVRTACSERETPPLRYC